MRTDPRHQLIRGQIRERVIFPALFLGEGAAFALVPRLETFPSARHQYLSLLPKEDLGGPDSALDLRPCDLLSSPERAVILLPEAI